MKVNANPIGKKCKHKLDGREILITGWRNGNSDSALGVYLLLDGNYAEKYFDASEFEIIGEEA